MSIVSRFPLRALSALPLIAALAAVPAAAQSRDEEVVVTSPAHAGQNLLMRSVAVAVSDLDLADGSDFARLHRRVQDAAERVCADTGLWSSVSDLEHARCYKSAVSGAMAHVMAGASTSPVAAN